jgi:hypothetical protein
MTDLSHTRAGLGDADAESRHLRPSYGRALSLSLTASALLHLAAIYVYPRLMDFLVPEAGFLAPVAVVPPQGTEVVNLREVPDGEVGAPEPLERREEVVAPRITPLPPGGTTGRAVGGAAERALTTAERLRPRETDSRLFGPLVREIPALTDAERAELEIAGLLEAWNDSVAAAAERARRATDWTYTDEEGRRWGVSPGQIHLGDITLPFSNVFLTTDEADQRAWEWGEIEGGASAGAVRGSWRDRAEAIRRRRDQERAARRAEPDTTSVRHE